jgi:hypothetical protein
VGNPAGIASSTRHKSPINKSFLRFCRQSRSSLSEVGPDPALGQRRQAGLFDLQRATGRVHHQSAFKDAWRRRYNRTDSLVRHLQKLDTSRTAMASNKRCGWVPTPVEPYAIPSGLRRATSMSSLRLFAGNDGVAITNCPLRPSIVTGSRLLSGS